MAQPIGNPASAATLGGVGLAGSGVRFPYSQSERRNLVGAVAIAARRATAPYLRISRHSPIKYITAYSVVLVDGYTRKRLCTVHSRRTAIAAARRLARRLSLTVRGRWSGFYRKFKREEFERRQQRVAARAARQARKALE
jgi:hypothetical protein